MNSQELEDSKRTVKYLDLAEAQDLYGSPRSEVSTAGWPNILGIGCVGIVFLWLFVTLVFGFLTEVEFVRGLIR